MTDLAKKTRVRNDLAETLPKYDFSKVELDIFFYLLSKITKDHTDETTYILDARKLVELSGGRSSVAATMGKVAYN